MRVLVYGAGKVGSTAGGFLSRHHDVTFLGRRRHLGAIKKSGLHLSGIWGKFHFKKLKLETDFNRLKKAPAFDLILVTVKSYGTPAAAKEIGKILKPHTLVLSLQNGLGNAEALARFIPKKQILAGRVIFGAAMPVPGHIKITVMAEPTAIGEAFGAKLTPRVKTIVKAFQKSGFPCAAAPDVQKVLWAKVVYNCALNPLASILNCHYGLLTESEKTRSVMNDVIAEIYAVAKRKKVKMNPSKPKAYEELFYSRLVPRTYLHRPSMLQDLEGGKRTEIGALNGAITKLGKSVKVKTPVNRFLEREILSREA